MEGVINHFVSSHIIDVENNSAELIPTEYKQGLEQFITEIIERRLNDKKAEKLQIRSNNTKVVASVLAIEKNVHDGDGRSQDIADHLLKTETEVTERFKPKKEKEGSEAIEPFTKIKKSILIQSLLEYEKNRYYLLAKVESNLFLAEGSWDRHTGFPFEKHVLKSCLIKFVKNPGIEEILVYDSNPEIAVYWWDEFLEMDWVRTSKYNTEQSIKAINFVLSRKLKKKSPDDLSSLDEGLREYLHETDTFKIKEVADLVLKYQPANQDLNMEEIAAEIKILPEKKQFNEDFQVDRAIVEKARRRVIPLTPQIDLILKDSIRNLGADICVEHVPGGNRYVKIRVWPGFPLPNFPSCTLKNLPDEK